MRRAGIAAIRRNTMLRAAQRPQTRPRDDDFTMQTPQEETNLSRDSNGANRVIFVLGVDNPDSTTTAFWVE